MKDFPSEGLGPGEIRVQGIFNAELETPDLMASVLTVV